jgi:hypothetical protein
MHPPRWVLAVPEQEILFAFLDGRVQELERNERVITEEKKKLLQELEKVKEQNSQKVRVLGAWNIDFRRHENRRTTRQPAR